MWRLNSQRYDCATSVGYRTTFERYRWTRKKLVLTVPAVSGHVWKWSWAERQVTCDIFAVIPLCASVTTRSCMGAMASNDFRIKSSKIWGQLSLLIVFRPLLDTALTICPFYCVHQFLDQKQKTGQLSLVVRPLADICNCRQLLCAAGGRHI